MLFCLSAAERHDLATLLQYRRSESAPGRWNDKADSGCQAYYFYTSVNDSKGLWVEFMQRSRSR